MGSDNNAHGIYLINFNYQENAPWNIGKPQPALVQLFDNYPLSGPVLDAGCGAGDLAISIANRRHKTLGIDLSENAVEIAKGKVPTLKPEVQTLLDFRVGDALKPSLFGNWFDAIVDSGFYHLFDQNTRDEYAGELFSSLNAGGRYYLLGFAIDSPIPNAPKQVTQDEIRKRFNQGNGWNILSLEPAEFITMFPRPRDKIPAFSACIEKLDL